MKKNKLLIYGIFALALSFLLLIPMQGNIFSVAADKVSIKASSSVLCNGNTTFFAFGVA